MVPLSRACSVLIAAFNGSSLAPAARFGAEVHGPRASAVCSAGRLLRLGIRDAMIVCLPEFLVRTMFELVFCGGYGLCIW